MGEGEREGERGRERGREDRVGGQLNIQTHTHWNKSEYIG